MLKGEGRFALSVSLRECRRAAHCPASSFFWSGMEQGVCICWWSVVWTRTGKYVVINQLTSLRNDQINNFVEQPRCRLDLWERKRLVGWSFRLGTIWLLHLSKKDKTGDFLSQYLVTVFAFFCAPGVRGIQHKLQERGWCYVSSLIVLPLSIAEKCTFHQVILVWQHRVCSPVVLYVADRVPFYCCCLAWYSGIYLVHR